MKRPLFLRNGKTESSSRELNPDKTYNPFWHRDSQEGCSPSRQMMSLTLLDDTAFFRTGIQHASVSHYTILIVTVKSILEEFSAILRNGYFPALCGDPHGFPHLHDGHDVTVVIPKQLSFRLSFLFYCSFLSAHSRSIFVAASSFSKSAILSRRHFWILSPLPSTARNISISESNGIRFILSLYLIIVRCQERT
jgi:hypothetical protein